MLSAIAYGVGEEAGWRGLALPWLQKGRSAIRATASLAILHGLWHIPMFFYRFDFGVGMVVGFFIGLATGAIFMTFLFNGSGGSALMAMLWHTSWNIASQLALVLSDVIVAVMSTCVMIAALVIVAKYGTASLSPRSRYVFLVGKPTNVGRMNIPTSYGPLRIEAVYEPSVYSDVKEKSVGVITVPGRFLSILGAS